MSTKKGVKGAKKPREKLYSYDEYRKTFGIDPEPENGKLAADPKVFGSKLAHEALKKVRGELERK